MGAAYFLKCFGALEGALENGCYLFFSFLLLLFIVVISVITVTVISIDIVVYIV